MCEFQSLYYNDDGYVVHCKDCGYYQLAYGSAMLSLSAADYAALCRVVQKKHLNVDFSASENTRNVVIPTPSKGLYLLLTQQEALRLHEILEEAIQRKWHNRLWLCSGRFKSHKGAETISNTVGKQFNKANPPFVSP